MASFESHLNLILWKIAEFQCPVIRKGWLNKDINKEARALVYEALAVQLAIQLGNILIGKAPYEKSIF